MDDLDRGFRIDGRLLAWGTTLEEACDALGVVQVADRPRGERSVEADCSAAYRFACAGVVLTSPGQDRPVLRLCYQLAPPAEGQAAATWSETLAGLLGAPGHVTEDDLAGHPHPPSGVRYYASWDARAWSVGLSVYGGLREARGGPAAACLWLTWSAELAARPYLDDWRAGAAALERLAAKPSEGLTFEIDLPLQPCFPAAGAQDGASARDVHHALALPHILPTPEAIAARLSEHRFALWRNLEEGVWCASTPWDTIRHRIGAPVRVAWHDVAPARGAGFAEIDIDGWTVRDRAGSRAIGDALAALEALDGVTVARIEGEDY